MDTNIWTKLSRIVNFLTLQPQLEALEIEYSKNFQETFAAARLPFSLKEFKILRTNNRLSEIWPFIESQRESLKALTLNVSRVDDEDLRRLLSLKLEELTFIYATFSNLKPSSLRSLTIKKLSYFSCPVLNADSLIPVIEACPCVETLHFKGFQMSKRFSASIASNLKKLRNLNLSRINFKFPLPEMDQYPSLEALLMNFIDEEATKSFVEANPQLKYVKREYKSYYY